MTRKQQDNEEEKERGEKEIQENKKDEQEEEQDKEQEGGERTCTVRREGRQENMGEDYNRGRVEEDRKRTTNSKINKESK